MAESSSVAHESRLRVYASALQMADSKAAHSRAVIDAVKPRVTRSDCPAKQQKEITTFVHQGAVLCVSYRELAFYIRLALSRQYGDDTWNVIISKGLFPNLRVLKGSSCILSVPALACDLPASTAANPSNPAPPVKPDPSLAFSVLIYKAIGDVEPVIGTKSLAVTASAPASDAEGSASTATAVGASEAPAALQLPHEFPPQQPTASRVIATSVPDAQQADLTAILGIIGGAQRHYGLSDRCEREFCGGIKAGLTRAYGSTWHVVLARCDPGVELQDGDAAASGGGGGGARLIDNKEKARLDREKKTKQQKEKEGGKGGAATGTSDPDAHLPAFAVVAAPNAFLALAIKPHFIEPTSVDAAGVVDSSGNMASNGGSSAGQSSSASAAASPSDQSRTPHLYHLCVYQTKPGQGQPTDAAAAAAAAVAGGSDGPFSLAGWDGSASTLPAVLGASLWRNKSKTARTVLLAAAFACVCVYALFAFGQDNSCSRIVAYGGGGVVGGAGRTIADVGGSSGNGVGSGDAGFADLNSSSYVIDADGGGGSISAGSDSGVTVPSLMSRLGLGPLPKALQQQRASSVDGADSSALASVWSGLADLGHHLRVSFGIGSAASSSSSSGGSSGGFNAYLDSLLPPLPPDEGADSSSSSSSHSASFSALSLGLPSHCTRQAVLDADRRTLRSRSLIYATMIFFALASLVRVVGNAGEKGRMNGLIRGLARVQPALRRELTMSSSSSASATSAVGHGSSISKAASSKSSGSGSKLKRK